MFYRVAQSGLLLPLTTRCAGDEVLLHCARIGYNP